MTVEIPGSPLSYHDVSIIRKVANDARIAGMKPIEVHVSSRRLSQDGLRLFGYLPVRVANYLSVNEGVLIVEHRDWIGFRFEDTDA